MRKALLYILLLIGSPAIYAQKIKSVEIDKFTGKKE